MIISKKNEVYVRVDTEPNIARELSDFFTFEVPGARFMPTYRKRIWDGKLRLYNMMNGEMYFGLIPYIEEFAKRNDIDIEYKGDVNATQSSFTHGVCKGFIGNIKPKSNGKSIKLRDYQTDAVVHAIRNNRSLLLSPCLLYTSDAADEP